MQITGLSNSRLPEAAVFSYNDGMKAVIVTIGDELLIGQVINTNSAWLAGELTSAGFEVKTHISISDAGSDIRKTIDDFLPDNDLLIITGGLGPTNDDITKKVLADYFNTKLVLSEQLLSDVEERLRNYGASMNEKNREQAMFPESARILRNNHGTAAGMWFEKNGRIIISLPGVPREMKGIFNDHIKAALTDHFSLPEIVYKTIMFTGIGEAQLAEMLSDWEEALDSGIRVAYLPSPGQIRLRLGMSGTDREAVESILRGEIGKLHGIAGDCIYGYDNESLESVVGRMIASRGASLATAESCTGGAIASRITAIPGCSAWYKGGAVAYSNEIKIKTLGVNEETLAEHGAVSEETVGQMAEGAVRAFGADYALATSGIAGPDGGTVEKPVGTVWIAAAGPGFLVRKKFTFGSSRELNIKRATAAAFNLLRKAMLRGR